MTVQDIITLASAGYTAQQISQMQQPQMQQPQMMQPQMQQPQMMQPQMQQPQMQQPQMQQYTPVLPTAQVTDPLKDVMLQQYTNAGQNMYNVNNVVSEMIGANAPVKQGGVK